VLTTTVMTLCGAAWAQTDPRSLDDRLTYFLQRRQQIESPTAALPPALKQQEIESLYDVLGQNVYAFLYYALDPETLGDSFKDFLQTAARTRVDQQVGAPPGASASTTAATRTGLTDLIGFAEESGAVTQTIDQNVATLRADADGLIRFLSNQELFPVCPPTQPTCGSGPLKDLELTASFSTSDSGTTTLKGTSATTGSPVAIATAITAHQFMSGGARYAVLNNRDLRSKAYRDKWIAWLGANRAALTMAGTDLLGFVDPVVLPIQHAPPPANETTTEACASATDQYSRWLCETRGMLRGVPAATWPSSLQSRLDVLLTRMRALDPAFDQKVKAMSKAYLRYLSLRRSLLSTLVTDPGLTVTYTFSTPPIQPKLHTVTVAFAGTPAGSSGNTGTVTLNAGLDYFHEAQPVTGSPATVHWKDAHAALQFDRPLGPADSPSQLSVGLYYQYQANANTFTVPDGATTIPGTNIPLPPAGTQAIVEKGQVLALAGTLTLRLANGLKVPIGISWSNRSELVSGNRLAGHVGLTLDTTPLTLLQNLRSSP
jgi:hypothetical protein